jgi:hypothetical protein
MNQLFYNKKNEKVDEKIKNRTKRQNLSDYQQNKNKKEKNDRE